MDFGDSHTNKFVRVAAADPSRCQATHADYQCPFRAVGTYNTQTGEWEGPKYCPRHGANKGFKREEAESLRSYNLAKWHARIAQHADNPKIKSLRAEVGILKMMLETKLNACHTDSELLMNAHGISEMTSKIGDLIKTCHRIEKDTGDLLDRNQAKSWISRLVVIIAMYVSDPDVIQAMSEDMLNEFDVLLNQGQNAAN